MRTIHFYKWQGAGNDFILLDGRNGLDIETNPNIINRLCNRHFGIGADGLMVMSLIHGFDFRMTYYNSDGYEADMCGNGARCIVGLAAQLGVFQKEATFLARDGRHTGVLLPGGACKVSIRNVAQSETVGQGYFLNTGVPHLVVFIDRIDSVDVERDGSKLRFDSQFGPDGTNVNFVQLASSHLMIRTFERGVEAETLACGTGVVASAIAASLKDPQYASPVTCKARGGTLSVSFQPEANQSFSNVWLEGPAREVFQGDIEI